MAHASDTVVGQRGPRPPALAGAAVAVSFAMFALAGCSGDGGASPTTTAPGDEVNCDLLDAELLEQVFDGREFVLDAGRVSPGVCVFVDDGDGASVGVEVVDTPDSIAFENRTLGEAFTSVTDERFDEVRWTDELGETGHHLLARRGGTTVAVNAIGAFGLSDAELRAGLGRIAAAAFSDVPVTQYESIELAAADCDSVDLGPIESLVEDPDGVRSTPLPGTAGCVVTLGDGETVTLELNDGPASVADLDGVGGSVTTGGETAEITPEAVDGLGDRAVWLADPVTAGAGELLVVWEGRLVRAGVSGDDTASARDAAVLVSAVLVPQLVAGEGP